MVDEKSLGFNVYIVHDVVYYVWLYIYILLTDVL